MKYFLKIMIPLVLITVAVFQSSVNSGTIDSASLAPANVVHESTNQNVRSIIKFEAINDKAATLRTYHVELSFTSGLNITLSTQPAAGKAAIDTRKKLIIMEWSNVASGTVLTAELSIASQTIGTYRIQPSSLYYVDSARKTYATTCNSAEIVVRQDTMAPAVPKQVRSEAQEGAIQVFWESVPELDFAGYNIYRRTPATGFAKLNTTLLYSVAYQDSSVQHGASYYYAVTAVDTAGNESPLSLETGETYLDLKRRSIAASGIMAAAIGDVNGDGKADIVLSRSYTEVVRKTTTTGHKVEIYFGGNATGMPDVTIKGEKQADKFGTSLAVVDLNNDGYDDVIVGAPTYSPLNYSVFEFEQGKIYIYAGGPVISTSPAYARLGNQSQGCFNSGQLCFYADQLGAYLAPAGDLDGDSYQDLIVGAPLGATNEAGRVMVLHGGPSFVLWEGEFRCEKRKQHCGTMVAAAGDMNGDGRQEILVAGMGNTLAGTYANPYGSVYVLSGSPSLYPLFEYSSGVKNDGFGSLVASAGDMNGDGYADILVQSWLSVVHYAQDARILAFPGGSELQNQPVMTFNQSTGRILPLGDVNHDGYDDFAADGPTVYFGNAVGDTIPDFSRSATLLAAGDVDGDGIKDLVTSSSTTVTVLSIAPYAALPDIVFTSPHYGQATVHPNIAVQGTVKGGATRVLVKGQVVPVQADGSFTADVALVMGTNIFEIVAETPAGKISKRRISVSRVEAAPLLLAITTPDDNTVVNYAALTVAGTVSDSRAAVWVNGVRAVVSQGTFTAAGIALSEGASTIVATAQDDYGQTASRNITVILTSLGTIQGTVADASTGALLPGVTVTISSTGGVYTALTDASGKYALAVPHGSFTAMFEKSGYIRQTNSGSLIAGQTQTVDAALSLVPPLTLSITSPVSGAMVHASALQVNGLVSNSAQVSVNGYTASNNNGVFTATVPIQTGSNTVIVAASDAYGQTMVQSITVTLAGLRDLQEIFVEPTTLTFPLIEENTSWIGYLNVRNVGSANLIIGATGQHPHPFWIERNECTGVSLPPGGTCMLRVKFAPPVAGAFSRTYEISSNDADHPLYTVSLVGTASAGSDGYVVPDTGQKTCAGETPRNSLSYTDRGNGTVMDNNTGLVWQRTDDGQSRTWTDAGVYCSGLALGGQGGWRLPARNELLDIVDYGRSQPSIDPAAFPGAFAGAYWSVTEGEIGAWAVDYSQGTALVMSKTQPANVRCVLGASRGNIPYWDNGDNTVTDLQNGLMWPQQKLAVLATQDGAANVCAGNPIAGYTDWRVPTIKELATNRFNNCIMGDCRLWSSTVADHSACSQGYSMDLTSIVAENKATEHLLTCVRGGRLRQAPTAPVVSGIVITSAAGSAVVSWTTDHPSYGTVDYGGTAAYGMSTADPSLTTNHTVTLDGLAPSTTYHFRIASWSGSGLSAVTPDNVFTTRGEFEAVTLADIGNVTVMEVTGNYDARRSDGTINSLQRQEIAKEFLRLHPDEFDFLIMVSNFDYGMPQPEAKAFYLEVKNDTQGIGKTVFDNSTAFGSSGKLQGIIEMGNIAGLGVSPFDAALFDQTLDVLAHEQLHRWAAGVKFRNPDGTLNTALLGKDGMHWSYMLDTDGSLEYGNDWKDNKDGTYTSVSQPKYYSDLDLYLMGMLDRSKVTPLMLVENPEINPVQLPQAGATITGIPRTVTIDDIISAEGPRVPDTNSSQKTFKTGFVFITRPGTFTGSEPAAIETLRNAWAGKFASITGGKGSIAGVTPSLTMSIASPADGATITKSYTTVKGIVINSTGNETGVTVNGIPAATTGNQFLAEQVPLAEGANTITIQATDTVGNTAASTMNVTAATLGNYIRVSPNITSGIAPLDVTIRIDGTFSITSTSINASGPTAPEVAVITPDQYKVKMTTEGTYAFTINATGPDGITYQDTVTITVQNRTQMDKLLKAKWEGMKVRLINQDVEGAVGYFNSTSRNRYREIFAALNSSLPDIAASMQDIQLVYLNNRIGKYRIRKNEIYGGQLMTITYYIYFIVDDMGRWSIDKF